MSLFLEELTQKYRKDTRSLQAKDIEQKHKGINHWQKSKDNAKYRKTRNWASAILGQKKTINGFLRYLEISTKFLSNKSVMQ